MKCQVCNSEIKVNWGNSNIVLCEAHRNELGDEENSSKNKDKKLGVIEKIILIAVLLGLALFSLPFVALSALAFDSGFSWAAVFLFGMFALIPVSLIAGSIYILVK